MRVFITGASSGIGEALAREYRRRHPEAIVGLAARRADALAQLSAALGPERTPTWAIDVTDRDALREAGRTFVERHGPPDVVIANAGISLGTDTGDPDDAIAFEDLFRTNVIGMFDTFAPFVDAMKAARRGRLVGISSVAGVRGMPGAAGYCASKAAATTYLESLRLELRGSGVSVVTIAPGYIRTPLTARNRAPMPFLMDAEAFARKALDAIAARRSYVVIPWPMRWVAALLRALPNPVYDVAFARAPRKARRARSTGG